MPLPGTYVKVTLHFRNVDTSSQAHCVLWYQMTAGTTPTLANVGTFANAFKTAFSTAIPPSMAENCEVQKITLKHVTGGSEVEGDNTNGTIAGTVTSSDTLPEEDVVVIQRRTGLVGRNKRGRVFWPYVPETFQADGELQGGAITVYTAIATMIKNPVTGSGNTYSPCTLDHKNGILVPVVQTGVVLQICSRRDRRSPKTLSSVRV